MANAINTLAIYDILTKCGVNRICSVAATYFSLFLDFSLLALLQELAHLLLRAPGHGDAS